MNDTADDNVEDDDLAYDIDLKEESEVESLADENASTISADFYSEEEDLLNEDEEVE